MKYGVDFFNRLVELSLGDELVVCYWGKSRIFENCVFVKVTPKGFNILNRDTNRMLLRRHVYAPSMTGKEYPSRGPITNKFLIPDFIWVKVKKNKKIA